MARFVATVILALLPTVCLAQSWFSHGFSGLLKPKPAAVCEQFSSPVSVSDVSVKPLIGRQLVGLGDQLDIRNRGTFPQVTVAAELAGWCELRYTGRTRQTWDETVTPDGALQIGSTLFNKRTEDADWKPKPVELIWWTESHQLELTGRTSWPIQPYLVAHFHQFDLTGRSDTLESSERWQRWFPGIGAAFRVPFLKANVEAKIAAWQGFSTINIALRYSPIPYVTVGAEYLREEVRMEGLHHRLEGPVVSVGLRF